MPVSSLTDPPLEKALTLLETGFERSGMLTLVGECEVDYDGRAASHLPLGERLVILKPDGTLLVHRDEQRKSVNWQPPGSTHNARLDGDCLIIESVRTSPHEEIEIAFEALAQVSLLELDDTSDLARGGSEEDLRQRILADPDLLEPGFKAMATERETAAGAIDIYGEDASGTPMAVELKRRVGPAAVGQLTRYVETLERDLYGESVRGILVAPSVTDRAERLLTANELEFISLSRRFGCVSADTTDRTRQSLTSLCKNK
jgi:RecB family endonuclease NucS